MRGVLIIPFSWLSFFSIWANAVWAPHAINVCAGLLVEPNAFISQLAVRGGIEEYMRKTLVEIGRHPTFAALDLARILVVKSADSSPPAIWVFPAKTTAAQGLADGLNDDCWYSGNRIHKFVPPLEYQMSDLQNANPKRRLVYLALIGRPLFTSDGRTIRGVTDHKGFDMIRVRRQRVPSTQLIAAFWNHVDAAEPAVRSLYKRNYTFLLSELLLDERLLEVLNPAIVALYLHTNYLGIW